MSDSPPYPLLGGPWLIGGAQYMLSDEGGRAGDQRLQPDDTLGSCSPDHSDWEQTS
jgi:hypothetical protein